MNSLMTLGLPELAEGIRREHKACSAAAQTALDHAFEAGRLLLEAKALCGHGNWGQWLTENFDGSERLAQQYMRLAVKRPELEANPQRVSDLSLREAIALVQEKKPAPIEMADEWRRLIPPEGVATWLEAPSGDYAFIEHSSYSGFKFITVFRWGDRGGKSEGGSKPVRHDYVGVILDLMGFDWRAAANRPMAAKGEPRDYNSWFFSSHDDYMRKCVLKGRRRSA